MTRWLRRGDTAKAVLCYVATVCARWDAERLPLVLPAGPVHGALIVTADERSTMIDIRPVHPSDAPRWAELRAALWPEGSLAEHAAEIADFFLRPGVPLPEAVLVADDRTDGVVGFVELSRRSHAESCVTSPVAFLEGWYVSPGHRGRGVGAALVQAAEGWARAQGCSEFASDTDLDNTASAAAHQALGFEEVAVVRCFRKTLHVADDA